MVESMPTKPPKGCSRQLKTDIKGEIRLPERWHHISRRRWGQLCHQGLGSSTAKLLCVSQMKPKLVIR